MSEPPKNRAPQPQMRSEAKPKAQKPDAPAKTPWYRRPIPVIVMGVVLVAAVFIVARYLVRSIQQETTDDAFIDAHTVNVAPKIAGKVSRVRVDDNQKVHQGEILVEIDPRDFQAALAQKQAALLLAKAKLKTAETDLAQTTAHLSALQADVASAKASAQAADADAKRANDDQRRNRELFARKVISAQELTHSDTAAQAADANLKAAQKKVTSSAAQLKEGQAQVANANSQVQSAKAMIDQAAAEEAAAELNLSYTKISAPIPGRVTNRTVEIGQYVQTGQALMALVPQNVWVTANYKESQITRMRPGQEATIRIDAYPGHEWAAHVDSIQRGSGAQFSLLPPENATGNYVKVVQRVPVKIVFNEPLPQPYVLGPGMSVVPAVTVRKVENAELIEIGSPIAAAMIGIALAICLLRPREPVKIDAHEQRT